MQFSFLSFQAQGNKTTKLYWKNGIDFKKLILVFPVTVICECVIKFYRLSPYGNVFHRNSWEHNLESCYITA